jgi:hypothetical protein
MDLSEIVWGVWSGFTWLRIGIFAGSCECGDEPSGSGAMELVILSSCIFLQRIYWNNWILQSFNSS